tara:strand:- start:2643 stop:3824 length:1182 start_codon:yes stop_codon:yes gene_type:complete
MKLKSLGINLLISSTSIYIPLLFFSYYDYVFLSSRQRIEEKSRYETIDLKISAVKSGYMPLFHPDKILGHKETPLIYPIGSLPYTRTYYCNEGYGLITYKTDRFGLRNPDKKWKEVYSQSNNFIIGDSFPHGACVPEDSTITSILGKSINQNILNLSSSSNGPYEYIAILKSLIKPIIKKAKTKNRIILVFYNNDNIKYNIKKENLISDIKSIIKVSSGNSITPSYYYKKNITNFIKDNYPQSSKKIVQELTTRMKESRPTKIKAFIKIITLLPIRIRRYNFTKNFTNVQNTSLKKLQDPTKKSISLLNDICKDLCVPYVLYIPNSNYWRPDSKSGQYKLKLRNLTKEMNIRFIDGEEVVASNNRNNYAPEGPHLSKTGYKKIANLIIKNLSK